MFKKFFCRENEFECFLNAYADNLDKIADEFYGFLRSFNKEGVEDWVKHINKIEHDSDIITHQTMNWLEGTFIVDYDREDIHNLVSHLDDIIDFVDAASARISIYNITEMKPEVVQLAEKLQLACHETAKAVRAIAGPKLNRKVLDICKNVKDYEGQGDEIYHAFLASLFRGGYDALDVIRFKEIIEEIERSLDRCNQTAMDVESIIFKYS